VADQVTLTWDMSSCGTGLSTIYLEDESGTIWNDGTTMTNTFTVSLTADNIYAWFIDTQCQTGDAISECWQQCAANFGYCMNLFGYCHAPLTPSMKSEINSLT